MRIAIQYTADDIINVDGVENIHDAGQIREAVLRTLEDDGLVPDYVLAADCISAVDRGDYVVL